VLPRCALCPLFDAERAIRAGIRETRHRRRASRSPSASNDSEISFGSNHYEISPVSDPLTLLGGELPSWLDADFLFPDFVPKEWAESAGEEPSG
jgi:hypothetical protein